MSVTPGPKLSPFGNSINKSLLTPCRRVGLSRKKKTPNSIKDLSQDGKSPIITSKLQDRSLNITPVNKNTSIKRKSLADINSTSEKCSKLGQLKNDTAAKKSLSKCFTVKETETDTKATIEEKFSKNIPINTNKFVKIIRSEKSTVSEPQFLSDAENNENSEDNNLKNVSDVQLLSKKHDFNIKNMQEVNNAANETVTQTHVDKCKLHQNGEENVSKKQVLPHEVTVESVKPVIIKTVAQIHVDCIPQRTSAPIEFNNLMDHDYSINSVLNENPSKGSIEEDMNEDAILRCISEDKFSVSSANSSPLILKSRKRRILSDSDEDFSPIRKSESLKTKTTNRIICVDTNESGNSDIINKMKDCTVSLSNLNKHKGKQKRKKMFLNDDDDEEDEDFCPDNSKTKKKLESKTSSNFMLLDNEDDEDFWPYNSKSKKKLKSKNSSKSSMSKVSLTQTTSDEKTVKTLQSKSSSKIISNLSSVVDEDENAFTSTPDSEKSEKRGLIDQIKELESKIKQKKLKIDNLNRASVYKSKHNIEELKNVTKIWKNGCILGLNRLLEKLQSHGPIDMNMLLKNLHIPEDMVSRIFNN